MTEREGSCLSPALVALALICCEQRDIQMHPTQVLQDWPLSPVPSSGVTSNAEVFGDEVSKKLERKREGEAEYECMYLLELEFQVVLSPICVLGTEPRSSWRAGNLYSAAPDHRSPSIPSVSFSIFP